MSYEILYKKICTLYEDGSGYDIDYLDETSDLTAQIKMDRGQKDYKQHLQNVTNELDYFEKETQGKIQVSGHFRETIRKKYNHAPEKLDNETIKKEIISIIKKQEPYKIYSPKKKKTLESYGHHCLFSLSEETMKRIENAGESIDRFLAKAVTRSLRKFNEQFHPGDQIGYAFGIHHDTDNRHAHIYLSNRTKNGSYVAMSQPLKGKYDKNPRKNQIGWIQNFIAKDFVNQLERLEAGDLRISKRISKNVTNEINVSDLNKDKLVKNFISKEKELNEAYREFNEVSNEIKYAKKFYDIYRKNILEEVQLNNKKISDLYSSVRSLKRPSYKELKARNLIKPKSLLNKFKKLIWDATDIYNTHKRIKALEQIRVLKGNNRKQFEAINSVREIYVNEIQDLNLKRKVVQSNIETGKAVNRTIVKDVPLIVNIIKNPAKRVQYLEAKKVFFKNGDYNKLLEKLIEINESGEHTVSSEEDAGTYKRRSSRAMATVGGQAIHPEQQTVQNIQKDFNFNRSTNIKTNQPKKFGFKRRE